MSWRPQKLFHEEYAVYVLSYHASIELLHALKAATPKSPFIAFLEKTQADRAKQLRGLDLSSFLIMPGTPACAPPLEPTDH
jgi:hypothetical protein